MIEKALFEFEQEKLGQPILSTKKPRKKKSEQYNIKSSQGELEQSFIPNTPSEAAISMISNSKKLSKKFNYDVLDSLLESTVPPSF